MRVCPKCSKQIAGASKICRDCGAILEEVADDALPESRVPSQPSTRSGSPFAVESPAAGPGGRSEAESEEPILAEVVRAGRAEPTASAPETAEENRARGGAAEGAGAEPSGPLVAAAWNCPRCGETVPGTFDACWKCLTTREGEKTEEREPETLRRTSAAAEDDREAAPTHRHTEGPEIEVAREHRPTRTACPRCGAAEIMCGVTVRNAGEGTSGVLQVVIVRNPDALIFKDRLYGQLKADICGECGHVELRVTNPKQLYEHYLKSPESDPWAL